MNIDKNWVRILIRIDMNTDKWWIDNTDDDTDLSFIKDETSFDYIISKHVNVFDKKKKNFFNFNDFNNFWKLINFWKSCFSILKQLELAQFY